MILFSKDVAMRRAKCGQAALLSLVFLSSLTAARAQDGMSATDEATFASNGVTQNADSESDSESNLATSNDAFLNATLGGKIPTKILLKNLDKQWRRISISDNDSNLAAMYGRGMQGRFLQDAMSDMGLGVYYTRGQSVALGGETYLIAYRIQMNMNAQETRDMMNTMWGGHGAQPNPVGQRKFAGTTPLLLSLLNLRATGSLEDVKPFDAARDILGPRDIIEASNNNLRQIGTFIQRLKQPGYQSMAIGMRIRNLETLRQMMANYFHAPASIFRNPATLRDYGVNALVFNRKSAMISNARQMVAVYEEKPGSDGKRGALFLDGRVERVPESAWKNVLARKIETPSAQKISAMSLDNLRRLGRALVTFNTRASRLPDMTSASTAQREISRYNGTWNSPMFRHPVNNGAYAPNKALSRLKLTDILNRAALIAYSENGNGADGKRGVVFLNGRVERLDAARWNRVIKTRVQLKTIKS